MTTRVQDIPSLIPKITLTAIAFASYLYGLSSGYDASFMEFRRKVSGLPDLNRPEHTEALIEWLRKWGWNGREDDWLSIMEELTLKAEKCGGEPQRSIGEVRDSDTGWYVKMYSPGRLSVQGNGERLISVIDICSSGSMFIG